MKFQTMVHERKNNLRLCDSVVSPSPVFSTSENLNFLLHVYLLIVAKRYKKRFEHTPILSRALNLGPLVIYFIKFQTLFLGKGKRKKNSE